VIETEGEMKEVMAVPRTEGSVVRKEGSKSGVTVGADGKPVDVSQEVGIISGAAKGAFTTARTMRESVRATDEGVADTPARQAPPALRDLTPASVGTPTTLAEMRRISRDLDKDVEVTGREVEEEQTRVTGKQESDVDVATVRADAKLSSESQDRLKLHGTKLQQKVSERISGVSDAEAKQLSAIEPKAAPKRKEVKAAPKKKKPPRGDEE